MRSEFHFVIQPLQSCESHEGATVHQTTNYQTNFQTKYQSRHQTNQTRHQTNQTRHQTNQTRHQTNQAKTHATRKQSKHFKHFKHQLKQRTKYKHERRRKTNKETRPYTSYLMEHRSGHSHGQTGKSHWKASKSINVRINEEEKTINPLEAVDLGGTRMYSDSSLQQRSFAPNLTKHQPKRKKIKRKYRKISFKKVKRTEKPHTSLGFTERSLGFTERSLGFTERSIGFASINKPFHPRDVQNDMEPRKIARLRPHTSHGMHQKENLAFDFQPKIRSQSRLENREMNSKGNRSRVKPFSSPKTNETLFAPDEIGSLIASVPISPPGKKISTWQSLQYAKFQLGDYPVATDDLYFTTSAIGKIIPPLKFDEEDPYAILGLETKNDPAVGVKGVKATTIEKNPKNHKTLYQHLTQETPTPVLEEILDLPKSPSKYLYQDMLVSSPPTIRKKLGNQKLVNSCTLSAWKS